MDRSVLLRNLQVQLTELEMLESMFSNPGEIRVGDAKVLNAVRDFVRGKIVENPPLLDITINLQVGFSKIELYVDLPHGYPDIQPEVYVRNQKLDRLQHSKLNKNLSDFLGTVEKGEPCIFSAVSWLQDNVGDYVTEQQEALKEQPVDTYENLARYWIYSHHIYSKTKRREILDLTGMLKITGFCMPGKPGIICIEGRAVDCEECWQAIKSMSWKKIMCRLEERSSIEDRDAFLKFDNFEEMVFQNSNVKCHHMNMGDLLKFLEKHNCGKVFKDLFGVDAKTTNS